MNGPVRRSNSRRPRPLLLIPAVAVVLIVVGSAAAAGSSHASRGTTTRQFFGVVHYGKAITPRSVDADRGRGRRTAPGRRDPDGEPPPGLGGGKALHGPPVVSDVGPRRGGRRLSRTLTTTGSFAALETLTAATFGNTCTVNPSDGLCYGSLPPDTQMAAGNNEIVEAVNDDLFVFTKGGTQVTTYPLTNIFQPPNQTVGLTDPKILFDPTTGNYYMTEMVCEDAGCGADNYTHMGISLAISSDPGSGAWTIYDYLNDGQDLQDQEKLGFSGDKITFAVNEYGCKCGDGSKFKQENVVVVQKSDVVAGNSVTPAVYSANSYSSYIFDSMPTTPINASTSDNTQYVVWDKQATSSNEMALIRITGTPNAHNVDFTSSVTKIGIADQTAPPAPVQQGGTLAGDKQNFQSATVQGNDLWAVATDGCTPQYPSTDTDTRDCTRLVEVSLSGNTIVNDIDIGTDGTYRINPSVSKDTSGHVFFGFTISSASTYATAAVDGGTAPSLPAVFQRLDFASGDTTYSGDRWGDYSGTQQDPSDTDDVWTAQEFGACTTPCSFNWDGDWATAIAQLTFRDPHITSISPNQGPVTGGTAVDIYGSEFAHGGTTVRFGSNASSTVTWLDSTHIRAVSPAGAAGTVDVTATTAAGTSDTTSADRFTYLKIPTTTTYTGPTSRDYHDAVTLSARLTSNLTSSGVAGETIAFTLGAESCSGVTDSTGRAACTVTPLDVPGAYTVAASFAGDATYLPSSTSSAFTVTKEETTVAFAGPLVVLAGASTATLSGRLVEDGANDDDGDGGSAAIAGRTVTLSIGSQSCSATTDALGNVTCQIASISTALGPQTARATFAGDAYYRSASDTKNAVVFAFPSSGAFALGDISVATATPSTTLTWWSNNWYLLNSLSGGVAPPGFKGFASSVTLPTKSPADVCSGSWSTAGGNAAPPPATVPSYMGVIVTSKVTKSGNTIGGSYAKIVVVRTDPGYAPGPQNAGTGTIVATFCP